MIAFAVIVGLAVGNFVYAAAVSQDYVAAFQRSFFNAWAICVYVGVLHFYGRHP